MSDTYHRPEQETAHEGNGTGEVNVSIVTGDRVHLHNWIDSIGDMLQWTDEHRGQAYDEYVLVLKRSPDVSGWREDGDDFIIEHDRLGRLVREVEGRWCGLPRTYHEKLAQATATDGAFRRKGYIELSDIGRR